MKSSDSQVSSKVLATAGSAPKYSYHLLVDKSYITLWHRLTRQRKSPVTDWRSFH